MRGTLTCLFLVSWEECLDRALRDRIYKVRNNLARDHLTKILIGSLSNDDSDVNKNDKKAIGSYWQNNSSARASRFLVNFSAVTARLRRENALFHVLWRT